MKKYVSWRRVSTKRQGESKLGLNAQTKMIKEFIKESCWIKDFCEVYTGKELAGCKELRKAIELCKKEDATLVIAKTDRFRNAREALEIFDEMNENIVFCDLPENNKFMLTISFAYAESEVKRISNRITEALAQLKEKGGTKKLWAKNSKLNDEQKAEYRKEVNTAAAKASAESRRIAAKNNPLNVKLWFMLDKHYKALNGKINANTNFKDVADFLNSNDLRTPKGLEFNGKLARATYYRLQNFYN